MLRERVLLEELILDDISGLNKHDIIVKICLKD